MIELDIDPETKKAVAVCLSVLLVLSSPVGMVLADDLNADPDIWFDDFEDGDANGWSGGSIVSTSYAENNSLRVNANDGETATYNDGPTIGTASNYSVTAVWRGGNPHSTGTNELRIGFGSDIIFDINAQDSITSGCSDGDLKGRLEDGSAGTTSRFFTIDDCEWYYTKVFIDNANNVAKIKHWKAGTSEPSTWDDTITIDNTGSGSFYVRSMDAPFDSTYLDLDNVTISEEVSYSINGTVWNDTDNDNLNDTDESGLSGVTVEVIDSDGDVVNSGTTDANGDYSIGGIPNGTYSVDFSASGHEDETYDVVNVDGSNVDNIDVGLAPTASVSGSVLDAETDSNISGATITAYNSSGGVVNTTTSASDGAYSLGLPNGTYTLEANATGYANATKTVSMTLGTDKTGVDFELEPQPEEELELDTKRFIEHGEAVPYTAEIVTYDGDGNKVDAINVTGDDANLTVTSNNTTALTVDDVGYQLVGTSDDSVNVVVNVTAEFDNATYSNLSVSKDVTVASLEMSNLKIIPGVYRISAIFGTGGSGDDAANQTDTLVLLIAILSGVVGARWTTVFGGISFMVLTILIGWFGGWVSLGLVFVTVFVGAFLGLNVAVNIDYEVRPG